MQIHMRHHVHITCQDQRSLLHVHRCITKEKEVIKEDTKEGQSGEDQSGEDQGSDDESFRAPKSKVAKGAFYSPGPRKSGWLSNGICLIH